MRPIDMIVVHCSDTPPTMDIGVEEIDQWHRERGWNGVGYHYVIRRDGVTEMGRPVDQVGAHVKGHNAYSIGICLVGGADGKYDYTFAQWYGLRGLLDMLALQHPEAAILGHRDLDEGKTCPNFDVRWLR